MNKKNKKWKEKKIKARFKCALSISLGNKKIACVEGKVEGIISSEPRGKKGFGYDPIFIPEKQKNFADELIEKYKIDHSLKPLRKLKISLFYFNL